MYARLRRGLACGLLLALGGCAERGARDAESAADAEQTIAEEQARDEQARVTAAPDPPPNIPDSVVQNHAPAASAPRPTLDGTGAVDPKAFAAAEEARDEAEQQAREQAKWQKLGRDADRKNTAAYARDRLAKAIERVNDAGTRTSRLGRGQRPRFNNDVLQFETKRHDVERRIDALPAIGNDEWTMTKNALDEALDQLDGLSYRIAGEV